MRKMYKRLRGIFILVFLFVSCFSLFAETAEELPFEILHSVNTGALTPGSFIGDSDSSTKWCLEEGSQTGWVRLDFSEFVRPIGIYLDGDLQDDTSLSLEYLSGNRWIPFSTGNISELGYFEDIIDISNDEVVTGSLRIVLMGENAWKSSIYEARVIGRYTSGIYHKIPVLSHETTFATALVYPASHLYDGNTYTSWRTRAIPYDHLLNAVKIVEDFLSLGEERNLGSETGYDNRGEALLDFGSEYVIEKVRIFRQADAKGDVLIETFSDAGQLHLQTIPADYFSIGWNVFDYSIYDVKGSKVRISIESHDNYAGGIGEIEFWGRGDYSGISYTPFVLISDIEEEKSFQAFVDKRTDTTLEIIRTGHYTESLRFNLNGIEKEAEPVYSLPGYSVYRVTAKKSELYKGYNFLKIPGIADSEENLTVRLAGLPENGIQPRTFGVNGALTAVPPEEYPRVFNFDNPVHFEYFEVDHESYTQTGISYQKDGEWTSLMPVEDGEWTTIFPGGVVSDKTRIDAPQMNGLLRIRGFGSPEQSGAPKIESLWPEDGTIIDKFDHNLKFLIGHVDNADSNIFVNGYEAGKAGHFFWIRLSKLRLKEEPNTILISAEDSNGRLSEKEIIIYLGENYFFLIDQDDETIFTTEPSVTISGKVLGRRIIEINGENVDIRHSRFSHDVPLAEGFNLIEITGRDRRGNIRRCTRRVVRYSGSMEIYINSPPNYSLVNTDSIVIGGSVSGAGNIDVRVNGVRALVEGNVFSSLPVLLVAGENNISIEASDQAGRTASTVFTIIKDCEAPTFGTVIPENNEYVTTTSVSVEAEVYDNNEIWVTANGIPCKYEHGVYTASINLREGDREITFEAMDGAGNTAIKTIHVMVDATPPADFSVNAAPPGWTNTMPVLTFKTVDNESGIDRYEMRIADTFIGIVESPHQLESINDGEHEITITAIDKAGWQTTAMGSVFIDTTPPRLPDNFRGIPGKDSITLVWETADDDVVEYRIEREPAWDGIVRVTSELALVDDDVHFGSDYRYRICAVDRASNMSVTSEWESVIGGIENEPYDTAVGAIAEYEGVNLFLAPELFEEPVAAVEIIEAESEELTEEAVAVMVSPMYDFSLVDAQGEKIIAAGGFRTDFIGSISYDETLIPTHIPEENLGVYYFDPLWGRWVLLDASSVDPDTNTIYFVAHHFSLYSVQATPVEEISPDELKDTGYSPFKTYARHEDLLVSPQGGSVSTRVTELVLSGPDGFDLVISRRYDLNTAISDCRVFGYDANLAATTDPESDPVMTEHVNTWIWGTNSPSSGPSVPVPDTSLSYLANQGDYAYYIGEGWRLDLPFIKDGSREQMVVLPGGSTHSIYNMLLETAEEGTTKRTLTLTNHDSADFTLKIEQQLKIIPIMFGDEDYSRVINICSWDSLAYELIMKNGETYTFDGKGRVTSITDSAGTKSITIAYHEDRPFIDYIEDAIGRKVRFEYLEDEFLPHIARIYIENDPYGREVRYDYDEGKLVQATDAGGRVWTYGYSSTGVVRNDVNISYDLFTTAQEYKALPFFIGYNDYDEDEIPWWDSIKPRKTSHKVYLLSGLQGPGKGIVTINYELVRLEYQDSYTDRGTQYTRTWTDLRFTARRVYTYNSPDNLEKGIPARSASYRYDFQRYNKENGDYLPYVEKAVESDGIRDTEYFYDMAERCTRRWEIDATGPLYPIIVDSPSDAGTEAVPRLVKTEKYDTSSETLLETEITSYAGNETKPESKALFHGNNTRSNLYEYDEWGNVTRNSVTGTMNGRESRIEIFRRYLKDSDNTEPDGWRAYSETGFQLPGELPPKSTRDLLLMERIDNYAGELPEAVESAVFDQTTYTYYEYNDLGQCTGKAEWDNSRGRWNVVYYTYEDTFGGIASVIDSENNRTLYEYDDYGYLSLVTKKDVIDADGNAADITTVFSFDPASGWKLSETNPRKFVTSYEYDALGRVEKIIKPDDDTDNGNNPVIHVEYSDSLDDLRVRVTDEMDRITRYDFDSQGRLVTIDKDSGSSVTTLSYNRWGHIAGITDPNGNHSNYGPAWRYTTRFTYDALGRRTGIIYPDETASLADNPVRSLVFNYETNILTITDENGNVSTETYDMFNRMIRQTAFRTEGAATTEITTRIFHDGAGNEIVIIDPRGAVIINHYNSLNQLIEVQLPEETFFEEGVENTLAPVKYFRYDSAGRKIQDIIETAGGGKRITNFILDSLDRVIQTETSIECGGITELLYSDATFYDETGNTIAYLDANNMSLAPGDRKAVSYTYNSWDKVLTEIDQAGNTTNYTYYPDGTVKSVTDPRGTSGAYPGRDFTMEYFYDNLKRLEHVELPSKTESGSRETISFQYDPRGNLLTRINMDESENRFTYLPRHWKETETLAGDSKSLTTSFIYDKAGNILRIIDPRGQVTKQEYDDLNRLVKVTLPEGNTEWYGYDIVGNQISLTDGNGNETCWEYNNYNKVIKTLLPGDDGSFVEMPNAWDRFGNLTRSVNASGHARTYTYDDLDRLIREIDPEGFTSTFGYDSVGNLTSKTDANGTLSTYTYSANYLLERASYQNDDNGQSKTVIFAYDEVGGIKMADDSGVVTYYNNFSAEAPGSYRPDVYGRVLRKTNTLDGKTLSESYGYDLADRVNSLTYPNGQELSYSFNALGQLMDLEGYLEQAPAYENGLLKEITAANGVGTIFDYDKNGRLTAMDYDSTAGEIKHYAITYDDANNIRILNDNQYVYDVQNRLTHAWLKGEFTVETEGTEGERYGIRDEDHFGEKILNTLDEEVAKLTLTELDYAARSIGVDLGDIYPVSKIDLASTLTGTRITEDQIRVFISPDNLNYQEVTDLQVTKGTGPTDSFEIYLVSTIETRYIKIKTDYDDRDKDFNFVPAETVATFKNSLSSLIRVYYTYDTREEEYVYDVGGNRVRESITTRGTGTRQYHYYPNTNRLMTDGIYAYTYDPNGNIIAKCTHVLIDSEAAAVLTVGSDYWDTITGSIDGIEPAHEDSWWEYSYDLLNRLTKVHKNGEEVAAYSYNAEGLRIRKQKNGQSTWYAFSLSGKLIYKEKEQTFTNYIYANGQLFAMEEGTLSEVETTRRYLHTDHLGSVVAATNIDGDIVWANDYTPFGETTGANGFNDEFARFTGKEMDPDTGLYYSNARWYDPELGRFITEDPIKDGLNYYVYCANNPLRYTDPTGLRLDDDLETDLKRNDREEIESYNSKIESASSISEAEEMEQKQLELMGEYNRNYDYTSETLYPGSTVSQEYKDKQQRLLLKDGNYLSYTHSGIDRVNGKDMMSPGYYRVIATDDGFVFERIGTDRRFRVLHMNPEELKRIKEGQIFVPGEKMGSYPSHPFGRTTSGTHAHIEETGLNSAGVRGFLNPDTHGDWTPGNVFSGIIEKQIIDKEGNVSWVPVRGWRRTTPR